MSTTNEVVTIKEYLPLVGVVIGGILVIVGGFVSNLWIEVRREKQLRKQLALAFEGEIGALLEIIEKRQYIEGLRHARDETKRSGKTQPFIFRAKRKYFSVFEANVGQIGLLLPPLSRLVSRFYTQANAILEDMQLFEEADFGSVDPEEAAVAYDQLLEIFEDTIATGNTIVTEVSSRYH